MIGEEGGRRRGKGEGSEERDVKVGVAVEKKGDEVVSYEQRRRIEQRLLK